MGNGMIQLTIRRSAWSDAIIWRGGFDIIVATRPSIHAKRLAEMPKINGAWIGEQAQNI